MHTDFRSESECLIRQPVPYRCDTCYGRASQTYCINLTRHLLWYRIRLILIMTDRCGSLFVCACERLSEGDYPHIVEKFPNDKWNYPTILSCSIFVVAFFYSNVFFFFIFFMWRTFNDKLPSLPESNRRQLLWRKRQNFGSAHALIIHNVYYKWTGYGSIRHHSPTLPHMQQHDHDIA